MTAQEITDQLQRIAAAEDLVACTEELTDSWSSVGAGVETIEPVLRFMEEHPAADFGTPGPLVHFVERFYRRGYEEKLVQSVERKPTAHTVWMLDRVITGTKQADVRQRLVATMERARFNPLADQNAIQRANESMEWWLSH